ncbi:SAF domain-containing protein [Streptomyces sp. SL13]|uniref:SAF domain-containing protein n=1 Tax=Streptantibioticus silvisoli TaxID=2705255 RepID=A0AA90H5Q5_9ACTN|nr:SAF domain-containing protein [Streptantibioticus silvisoli]MDI5974034.1 SAF domain-containing protein [Streptantibioticus silvisoli]
MVIVSSVSFAAELAHAGHKTPVLAVGRSLPAGAVVTSADVREVWLGVAEAGDHVVPLSDEDAVVGKTAVVPLVAGELLAPQEFGERAVYPPQGKAQVSFSVEPGGVPGGLGPGERVAVLPGASTGDQAQDDHAFSVVGTVTDVVAMDQESEAAVVTVLVDTAASRRAAAIDKPHMVILNPTTREVP